MDEDVAILLSLPIGAARDAFSKAFYFIADERRPFEARVFFVANGGVNALARQPDATSCTISFFAGMVVVLLEACLKLASRLEPGSCRPVREGDRLLVYPQRLHLATSRHDLEGDAFFKLGEHQFLAIFKVNQLQPDRMRHFGLLVRDEAQIKEVREKVSRKYGCKLEPEFRCDFRDPWGNRIQVVDLHDESLVWLLPYREVQKAGVKLS